MSEYIMRVFDKNGETVGYVTLDKNENFEIGTKRRAIKNKHSDWLNLLVGGLDEFLKEWNYCGEEV